MNASSSDLRVSPIKEDYHAKRKASCVVDRDGDDSLTEEEFSSLQKDEEGEGAKAIAVSPVEAERRREFREAIDVSKDGKASRHELLVCKVKSRFNIDSMGS